MVEENKRRLEEDDICAKCGQNFWAKEGETECDICSGRVKREDLI